MIYIQLCVILEAMCQQWIHVSLSPIDFWQIQENFFYYRYLHPTLWLPAALLNRFLPYVFDKLDSKHILVSFSLPISQTLSQDLEFLSVFSVQYSQATTTFAGRWAEHPRLWMAFVRQHALLVSKCRLQQATIKAEIFPSFPQQIN